MTVIQLHPVLTMQAMDTSSWEPALSYLLPENPPLELLERARDHVLTYLDWVATDLASRGDADAIRKEINRAATRLIQISLLLSFALTATIDERSAKERVERDQQRREQEIRLIRDQHEPKPNQLRPVLTMKVMDTSSWEPALSYLLPENPPLKLLERARDHVLTYLDWVATDLTSRGDADAIRKEINRAATRLIQISLLLSFALTATIDERSAKERVERDQQRREQERYGFRSLVQQPARGPRLIAPYPGA